MYFFFQILQVIGELKLQQKDNVAELLHSFPTLVFFSLIASLLKPWLQSWFKSDSKPRTERNTPPELVHQLESFPHVHLVEGLRPPPPHVVL